LVNEIFQKKIFDRVPVKHGKEMSDAVIIKYIQKKIQDLTRKGKIRVLDIGCGGGQLLETFTKTKYVEVYGLDISEKVLRIAKQKGYIVHKINLEKDKLPFSNEYFDIIVANDLIEHLIDPDKVLTEIHRVSHSNTKIIICVPNINSPISFFIQLFLDYPPLQSARYKSVHFRDYTLLLIKSVLIINAFQVEKVMGSYVYPIKSYLSQKIAHLFPRVSERLIVVCTKTKLPDIKINDVYFDTSELLNQVKKIENASK